MILHLQKVIVLNYYVLNYYCLNYYVLNYYYLNYFLKFNVPKIFATLGYLTG